MRYIIKIVHLISYRILPMCPFTLITFTLLLVTLSPAAAQEPDPVPWPPADPESLFGPDVEIISSQLWIDGSYNEEEWVYIADWGLYPIPYGLGTVARQYQLPGNRYYIEDRVRDGDATWWLIDLETGEWLQLREYPQQVQTLCGTISFREDQRSYVTGWVTITGSNQQSHLCNLETGYRTPPLPDGFLTWTWKVIERDASDELLFYTARPMNTAPESSVLFIHNMNTGESREVMTVRQESSPYADLQLRRLGETDYFLFTYPVPPTVNQRNRNQTALINLNQRTVIPVANDPIFKDAPARLIYRTESNSETPEVNCEVLWLDLSTLSWHEYTIPNPCFGNTLYQGGWLYLRQVNPERTHVTLMSMDELTGESRIVYEGEIEDMLWVSPDARYIALVMDSDNYIANLPGQRGGIHESLNDELWLIDLVEDRVLLKTPAYDCQWVSSFWCPILEPLNDDLVALQSSVGYPTTDLFSLTQGQLIADDIEGNLGGLFAVDWAFLYGDPQSEFGNVYEIDLYNVDTLRRVDLVALPSADYWLSEVTYVGESRFDITIGYDVEWMGRGENPLYNIITYRVRVNVPGLE